MAEEEDGGGGGLRRRRMAGRPSSSPHACTQLVLPPRLEACAHACVYLCVTALDVTADFNEKRKEWQTFLRQQKEVKEKEWKERKAAKQAEYEAAKKAYEEEEAKRDPWEQEKVRPRVICDPSTRSAVISRALP